jgi:hypothetical protein
MSSDSPSFSSDSTPPPTLRDCTDSLDSLHQRMDRFYAWASQLQVEHRDLKQRVGFLEGLVLQPTDPSVGSDSH